MSPDKPKRLGRGLEALLGAAAAPTRELRDAAAPRDDARVPAVAGRGEPLMIPVASIRANPFQPRTAFRPDALAALEASISANGLVQPVTVRPRRGGVDEYELVAGERRFRAVSRLGWTEVPALVRRVDDRAMLTLALVENLQRADLNPVDEATAVQRLIEEFGLTQQQVAESLGKDRSTITNLLRVLALPEGVRRLLQDEKLTLGHARALLMVSDTRALLALARETVEQELSVREVERRARAGGARVRERGGRPRGVRGGRTTAPNADGTTVLGKQAAEALRRYLQTDVQVSSDGASRGEVRLSFYSAEDLHRLVELILRSKLGGE